MGRQWPNLRFLLFSLCLLFPPSIRNLCSFWFSSKNRKSCRRHRIVFFFLFSFPFRYCENCNSTKQLCTDLNCRLSTTNSRPKNGISIFFFFVRFFSLFILSTKLGQPQWIQHKSIDLHVMRERSTITHTAQHTLAQHQSEKSYFLPEYYRTNR